MIAITDLEKHFPGVRAVDGLNFDVRDGECLGLVGPNGAGKSTTIQCLAGLCRPSVGEVLVDSVSMLQSPELARKQLGVVMQEPAIFDYLTGKENLEYIRDIWQISNEDYTTRTTALLKQFELDNALDRLVLNYSGGMRKKLAVICMLMTGVKNMVLDETFVGLDPTAALALKDELARLKAAGHAILVVSHLLPLLEQLCDRVVLIQSGKLAKTLETPQLIDGGLETEFRTLAKSN
jgi:ABC-2 type transport system ATP-binding protein